LCGAGLESTHQSATTNIN